ncbi:prenyltransferase [Lactobacillus crispatus]|uniref:prenyltransferase n=1 Tax=Lactobacillus crispatus TaxID=47770 RepID=UPI0001B29DFE|nr:prenyltransferase [Lactobacillus crispatus]EEU18673.1 prenyltransferase, UbiA family [Lactobacillus crispatus 125-2-CHN]EFD99004.1 1,4-dihydroxy-2-naphthoate octaprenyltransferase [Lactobacillus crispatus 214-1]MBO4166303.1 prenyltransferase [Lactobacillus crispatus]MCT7687580.1 prenyltransferase [Lactobacillus crispatus]MCT7722687.1 prenyltransferase [Lactobacillus crispatus]
MKKYSTLQKFNALVQIQTIIISALPYIIGSVMASYYYHNFNLVYSLWLFLAVICFHLAVNGHNQYTDYARYKQNHITSYNNILEKFNITKSWARKIIIILTLISAIIGTILSIKVGWIILLIGILSYLIGYCYSGGPYPILKTPFGEPASGITMGYNITFLGLYINMYNVHPFDNFFWAKAIIVAGPAIFVIANVMLANNICDVAEDVKIGRKTLPYYTGRKTALTILCCYYVLAYIFLILVIVLKYLPVITLGSLLTIPLVYHTTKTFVKNPHKESTFTGILVNVLLVLISEIIFSLVGLAI